MSKNVRPVVSLPLIVSNQPPVPQIGLTMIGFNQSPIGQTDTNRTYDNHSLIFSNGCYLFSFGDANSYC